MIKFLLLKDKLKVINKGRNKLINSRPTTNDFFLTVGLFV